MTSSERLYSFHYQMEWLNNEQVGVVIRYMNLKILEIEFKFCTYVRVWEFRYESVINNTYNSKYGNRSQRPIPIDSYSNTLKIKWCSIETYIKYFLYMMLLWCHHDTRILRHLRVVLTPPTWGGRTSRPAGSAKEVALILGGSAFLKLIPGSFQRS